MPMCLIPALRSPCILTKEHGNIQVLSYVSCGPRSKALWAPIGSRTPQKPQHARDLWALDVPPPWHLVIISSYFEVGSSVLHALQECSSAAAPFHHKRPCLAHMPIHRSISGHLHTIMPSSDAAAQNHRQLLKEKHSKYTRGSWVA